MSAINMLSEESDWYKLVKGWLSSLLCSVSMWEKDALATSGMGKCINSKRGGEGAEGRKTVLPRDILAVMVRAIGNINI